MNNDDEEDDSIFAFYSSSDISTDEEGQIPIKKRKRPRFLKKKGLLKGWCLHGQIHAENDLRTTRQDGQILKRVSLSCTRFTSAVQMFKIV